MLSRNATKQAWRIATRSNPISRSTTIIPRRAPALALTRPYTVSTIQRAQTPMAAQTDAQAEAVQSSTGITPDSLMETLKKDSTLNPSHVDVQDISGGCGASFAALIVSDAFQGKSALQRHRLVNGVLKEEIKAVHAWTPKCLTGEQWQKEKERMG